MSLRSILVLGGGTAGCVVAGRLARDHDVTVVEAGPDYGPLGAAWPADLLDAASLPTSHDWGYGAGRLSFDRARVIGGCSSHNGCSQSVGWAGDYDSWASAGCPGWSSSTLALSFESARNALRLRHYCDEEIQPFQRLFVAAASVLGLPARDDLDDLDAGESVGCAPVNIAGGVRFNTAFGYLDPVRAGGNLTVISNAVVDRIVFSDDRAVGAEFVSDGTRQRIEADLVVLAAGAYGSPEILLRSGIGPADHLAELGIPLTQHLEGVGGNLHDHPAITLEYAGTAKLAADLAAFAAESMLPEEQAIAKLRSPLAGAAPYDLHVYPWVEPDSSLPHGWRVVLPVALLRPRSRGTVRLRSADPLVRAEVDHAYLAHPDDVAALAHGLAWLQRLDLSPYLGEPLVVPPSDQDVPSWIRDHHQHYWHPAGSARMGPVGDPGAVVDHTGRVHGLRGLHIADASIFPDIPRSTPALPTTVVGERIAANIRKLL